MAEENKNEENNSSEDDKKVKVKEDGGDGNSVGDDSDDEFAPTTVVVMLGSMNFEPVESIDILSLKIQDPDERSEIIEKASKKIRPNSLEALHILLKSSSVSTLFDESILVAFFEGIIPGKQVIIHVLPESAMMADDMAVQPADVESVRMGLIVAGFLLKVEEAHEGSWVLTAIKPGPVEDSSDEEDEDEEEEPTEAEKEEEEEFRKLIGKELEASE
jgi:hypothetical protein